MLLLVRAKTKYSRDVLRLLPLRLRSGLKAFCARNDRNGARNEVRNVGNGNEIVSAGIPAKWRSRPMYCVPSMSLCRR